MEYLNENSDFDDPKEVDKYFDNATKEQLEEARMNALEMQRAETLKESCKNIFEDYNSCQLRNPNNQK